MSYNLLNPVVIFQNADMSMSLTSDSVEVKLQDNIGVQLHWTGSPTGAFGVQISMDHKKDTEGNVVVPGHWISLPLTPPIIAAGAPDDAYIDLTQMSAVYIRVTYAATGGVGSLNGFVNAKGV